MKLPIHLSFRTRLSVWYSVVLAALLAVGSAVLILTISRISERRFDSTLWVVGATEAEGVVKRMRERGVSRPDDLAVNDVDYREISSLGTYPIQKYVTIVNRDHEVVDASINLAGLPLPVHDDLLASAFADRVEYVDEEVAQIGAMRMVYVPVTHGPADPFVVIVGVPTDFVGAEVGELTRRIVLVSIGILILTVASGAFLARRALRPVARASVAAQRITERNLHERLPEPNSQDEIGFLIEVFNNILARLDRAFDVQRRFVADASHELFTPLTILKGDTEVALLDGRSPEEYREILRSNLEEIDRLSKLSNDLLLLASTDSGEGDAPTEVVMLNEILHDIAARLAPMAERQGVDLDVNLATPALIEGDAGAVRQVLDNLVGNAIRYTKRGGRVEVRLQVTSAGDEAIVRVADTGVGIPEQAIPHVFDRFFRAPNARQCAAAGSGLGLAICQALVERLGGRIDVESRLGVGSTFTLVLPIAERLRLAPPEA